MLDPCKSGHGSFLYPYFRYFLKLYYIEGGFLPKPYINIHTYTYTYTYTIGLHMCAHVHLFLSK